MARHIFRWIHLSDIHFGHGSVGDRHDQLMVLDRLRRDLDDAQQEGVPGQVDAILITGDIGFSGNGVVRPPDKEAHEYADARAWIMDIAQRFGLDERAVFMVAGNHDVNRGADKDRNTARLVNSLRTGGDDLDAALADPGDRALLAGRMRAYLDFADGFAPASIDAQKGRLFWSHRFTKQGLHVRLVGLNTALLASGDDDQGKLRLGKQQLREALGGRAERSEVVIALSHHPLSWLADARSASDWITTTAHIHLSGHVHEAESEALRRGGSSGEFVRAVAGASHAERAPDDAPAGHGYSWGAIVDDGGTHAKLHIWPRRWSDRTTDFRLDIANVPRGKTFAEHALPVEIPRSAAAASALASPAAPAQKTKEVFYFHAADDQPFLQKLETHLSLLRRSGAIASFSKRAVDAGASVKDAIDAHIETAGLFIALASPSFIASDYFDGAEWRRALERAKAEGVPFIVVYLRPFDRGVPMWRDNPASVYKAFPDPYDQLGAWVVERDLDLMFSKLAERVRASI